MISIEDPNEGTHIEIVVPLKMTRKNVQLPKRVWDALEEMAEEIGLSVAACIRMIVTKDLMNNKYLPR